jgi:SulP family sulfate permease
MVENIPFMHSICFVVHSSLYPTDDTPCDSQFVPTVLASFALTSLLTSLAFFLIGHYKLGNVVFFFPKHVILGCVGGIGIFVIKTGLEVSTGGSMDLNSFTSIADFFDDNKLLYSVPLLLVLALRALLYLTSDLMPKSLASLLPPLFFLSLTPLFYAAILMFDIDFQTLHGNGWMFPTNTSSDDPMSNPLAIFFPTYGLHNISISAILSTLPVQISCVIFSLMHAPINIPSMSISTGIDVDMNTELITHFRSNFLATLFAQPPNYMCYSNSIVYHRAGGRGELSSILIVLSTSFLFFYGGDIVSFIPRLMAGTLLIHVGLDLFFEGVYDSYYAGFDMLEYGSVWVIVFTMSLMGMTSGLVVGIMCAALTFVVNAGPAHLNPIRGTMPATTFISSRWRGLAARRILDEVKGRRRILCVQLQGHIYFANLDQFTEGVKKALKEYKDKPYRFVILDFTLVLGLDTSAALAIVKLAASLSKLHGIRRVAFVTGKKDGFPTSLDLMNQLSKRDDSTVHESLDEALALFEDIIIAISEPGLEKEAFFSEDFEDGQEQGQAQESAIVKRMLAAHLHSPTAGAGKINTLYGFFVRRELDAGMVLWRQGDLGDRLVLLVKGELMSRLEEEAGTCEAVKTGHFIGELALIMGDEGRRLTTVTVETASVVYEIDRAKWEKIKQKEPHYACLIMGFACRYLQHRVQHVSNRFVETRCIPI